MDRVNAQQRQEIVKTNTDRLRGRLLKAGLDEEAVFALDRNALMEAYAEFLLKPPSPVVDPQGAEGGLSDRSEQQLKLRSKSSRNKVN